MQCCRAVPVVAVFTLHFDCRGRGLDAISRPARRQHRPQRHDSGGMGRAIARRVEGAAPPGGAGRSRLRPKERFSSPRPSATTRRNPVAEKWGSYRAARRFAEFYLSLEVAVCLGRDGRPCSGSRSLTKGNRAFASTAAIRSLPETPATDGELVIAYFGMTGISTMTFEGKRLWTKDLGAYPMQADWGIDSSPVIFGDTVLVQCDNSRVIPFWSRLDKRTGDRNLARRPSGTVELVDSLRLEEQNGPSS